MLTPQQIALACKLNAALWTWPAEWGHPRTPDFAEKVAAFQTEKGLGVDGVMGPKTRAAYLNRPYAPSRVDYIWVGGNKVQVPFPVVDFNEPEGLSFYRYSTSWKQRAAKPSVFVLHWDVCLSSHQCFQVLVERGLSVHFMLDWDGVVYQALDCQDMALHAGAANQRSIGIEINNPIFPDKAGSRPIVRDQLKANSQERWDHVDFTDVQKNVAAVLARTVCEAVGIEKRYPKETGVLPVAPTNMLVGHYHIASNKQDPGFTLWPYLEREGFVKF